MNGWYGNVYDKVPALSVSIQIAGTKNMRMYCGQQRGTSNPGLLWHSPFKDDLEENSMGPFLPTTEKS